VELQLQAAVEIQPQWLAFGITRRMSRTVFSTGFFLLMDFCLIFVPFGHYDEPEILR
jgi:hypothetical protein